MYPLPKDYRGLSPAGRKAARLNAVSLRETADDDVNSWEFFREYYLNHDQAGWFDNYSDPAPGHYEWVKACAEHTRVVVGAHRGSAKSTIFSGEFPLRDVLTIPGYKVLFILSLKEKVERRMSTLMRQIEDNQRILDDFGKLRRPRGHGIWNLSTLELANGSMLVGMSVGSSGLRGERPHRVIFDDPEYDPKPGTSISKLIEATDITLFRLAIPMLRRGCSLHWIGTPISRKLFLWRICKEDIEDPRIDPSKWYRKIFPGEDGHGNAFWPAEYPPDRLLEIQREWSLNYGAEFLCRPASGDACPLVIDPIKNTYTIATPGDADPRKDSSPLTSSTPLKWMDCSAGAGESDLVVQPRIAPAGELYQGLMRYATIDAIRAPSVHSDFAAIGVFGIDRLAQRFLLDFWMEKKRYSEVAAALWKLVWRWKLKLVGVEAHGLETILVDQVIATSHIFAAENGWAPQIRAIKHPPGVEKEERFQALERPFNAGLIKYPGWLRDKLPFRAVFHQTEFFTPDGAHLEHDDALDVVSMGYELTRRKRPSRPETKSVLRTTEDRLRAGDRLYEGLPMTTAIDMENIDPDVLMKYLETRNPTPKIPKRPGGDMLSSPF